MALSNITKAGVDAALDEYDTLGGPTFLANYGFSDAKRYWLLRNGKRYPSKAIAGVAHKYSHGDQLLASSSFTGGEGSVVRKLRQLGFVIEGSDRNPAWNRDELIMVLSLYIVDPASPPGKTSVAVAELSDLLNKMHRIAGTSASETLRNVNGVYLKLMNLRALDPAYTGQGKVGMQSGGKLEKEIWDEYAGREAELAADAATIRASIENVDEEALSALPTAEPYEGEEGGVIIRLHKRYERDSKLVAMKRQAALAAGQLRCEVCSFDFAARYGDLGQGYIEIHHLKPVHKLKQKAKTALSDLALLCANCHRMAHRKRTPLTLEELRDTMLNGPSVSSELK